MADKYSNTIVESLQIKGISFSRMGHRTIRLGQEVLVLGGTDILGEFLRPILRFNLENSKGEALSNVNCPPLEGFSVFAYKDKVYLWGGNHQSKPCNLLWGFQGSNFDICPQTGQIPSARSFHCSVFVANRYLLVYGGFNETESFNDWYILDVLCWTWSRAIPDIQLPNNMKFKLIWSNGRGFMVSQSQVTKNEGKTIVEAKNNIYEIRIANFTTFKIRISPLESSETYPPPVRTDFSLFFVETELWIIGGERPSHDQLSVCNDIWAFDTETLNWSRKKLALNVKFGSELIGYKNRIYFFGGIKSSTQMNSNLQIINIRSGREDFSSKVCNFCKSVYSMDSNILFQKSISNFKIQVKDPTQVLTQISTNFLSKIAHTLQNPIQAIGLLIDNCLTMHASSISIDLVTPNLPVQIYKQIPKYLFIGDNTSQFNSEEILNILFSFRYKTVKNYLTQDEKWQTKAKNQYGLNLKMASLRLGSSCLFVTTTSDGNTFVAYFSQNEIECPDGDPCFNCFHYTIEKKKCSNPLNMQIIRENVKHMVDESIFLNTVTHKTKVYIFGVKDVNKIQNGGNNKPDIVYQCSHDIPLCSLSDYVSILYFGSDYAGRHISIAQNRVGLKNIKLKLKEAEHNNIIIELDKSDRDKQLFLDIGLYRTIKNNYESNYVYVYHEKRLICAIGGREKIICGYVVIPDSIEVDFFKSKIQSWREEKQLTSYIQEREEPRKRRRKIQEYTQDGLPRKMMPFIEH